MNVEVKADIFNIDLENITKISHAGDYRKSDSGQRIFFFFFIIMVSSLFLILC